MTKQYGNDRLQVRCQFDANRLHIQGIGEPTVNRKYGLALELRAPTDLTNWLNDQEPTLMSPASGSQLYTQLEMLQYIEHDNTVQLLIHGAELNHPKGAMLDISAESPAVQTLITFVRESAAGLMIAAGEIFKTEGSEEE